MKGKLSWKAVKHLFWSGPVLFIVGLVAGLVANSWGAVPVGLMVAGVVVIGLWLLLVGNLSQGFWGRRSTQASTNALVATVAVVVILGLINFLGVRYVERVDLTENQLYTLSSQTQEVLDNVEQPVEVLVFSIAPNPADRALLENYDRQSQNFSFEYVDPYARPGLTQQFGVQVEGEVYLQSGDSQRLVQVLNASEPLSERRLTSAIAQLSGGSQPKAYFLQGHGEYALEGGEGAITEAIAALEEEGFAVEPLNLAQTTAVPADAAVVILAAPQQALFEAEVNALENYLEGRSGLMLLVDPTADPGLTPLLEEWGLGFSDRIILDPAGQAAGGIAVTLVNQYGLHPATDNLSGYSFYPIAQPVEATAVEGVENAPLLFTNEQVQAQTVPEEGAQLQFDPNAEAQGPFAIGYAFTRPLASAEPTASESPTEVEPEAEAEAESEVSESEITETDEDAEARIVAIGNSRFIADGIFNQQLNGDVFLNAVGWLSQQDNAVLAIRPKEMTNRRLLLTVQQQIALIVTALVALPLIGFGLALLFWLRQR